MEIRKVLVTGNLGYIGSVLTPILEKQGYEIVGFDTDFYNEDCLLYPPEIKVSKQIRKDVRDITSKDLEGIDAVIHLAALSNDPLGEFNPALTEEINHKATIRVARMAKKAGCKRFVFASSQSMYGIAEKEEVMKEDSLKNPITAYAKTKWKAECDLKKITDDSFTVVCFRPSTVFGPSPKFRLDIVFNNLMGSAYTKKSVELTSDGMPWRPVVHIKDVCSAFIAGLNAPRQLIANESFNVGIPNGNYRIREIAEAARAAVPGSVIALKNNDKTNDERTYRVSFDKILTVLKEYYKPQYDLQKGGKELVEVFSRVRFTEEDRISRKFTRIKQLKYLVENDFVDNKLRWKGKRT